MVKVAIKKSSSAPMSKSKPEPFCIECDKVLDENNKGISCERCGEAEGTNKCRNCLSISEDLFNELTDMSGNNTLHWFCPKCEKHVLKNNNDLRIEAIVQLLTQAMDKISNLEDALFASQMKFENKIMNRIDATDNKVQLLLDVTIPPTMNDTMSVVVDDTNAVNNNNAESNTVSNEGAGNVSAVQRQQLGGWSELFNRVSEVAAEVHAVKEATVMKSTADQEKPKVDDSTARSVVIYGLAESRTGINDTLLIDQLIKHLDNTLSIVSHKRLRKKSQTAQSNNSSLNKPIPLLVTLSTSFDRRKLLSLAPNLKSDSSYKSVFIKKALTTAELQETIDLRQKCTEANEILKKSDPLLEAKYSVVDGKIRRLTRVNESGSYKVDWKKIFTVAELPKN